jgi:hypothetical protein
MGWLFGTSHEVMRSDADIIQPGGRLLFYDSIPLSMEERLHILLVLHPGSETGRYIVSGELYGRVLPEQIQAQLQIGGDHYETEARDGLIQFPEVDLRKKVHDMTLNLFTSNWTIS